jgi:hypothetical protein
MRVDKQSFAIRSAAVKAAIGSTKLEGLKVSRKTRSRLQDYAEDKITITEMRAQTPRSIRYNSAVSGE